MNNLLDKEELKIEDMIYEVKGRQVQSKIIWRNFQKDFYFSFHKKKSYPFTDIFKKWFILTLSQDDYTKHKKILLFFKFCSIIWAIKEGVEVWKNLIYPNSLNIILVYL